MKSDGFCVLLVRGFVLVRHISGDLKIALVFGVVCIGVEGFFFGLLFLLLLCESIEAAACRQRNQHDYAQKAGCDLCDLILGCSVPDAAASSAAFFASSSAFSLSCSVCAAASFSAV